MKCGKAGWLWLWVIGCVHAAPPDFSGRLFFSADERQKLERGEWLNPPVEGAPVPPTAASAPVARAAPPMYRVDGVVHRSSGRDTVWLNGQALPPGQRNASGVSVEPATAMPKIILRLPDGRRVVGRVGETVKVAP